jgi:hypothetical protein
MVRSIHDAANLSVDLAVGWRMTDFTLDITLSRALTQPNLFGGTFGASSFWTWRTVAKMIDGLPLTEAREVDLVKECTGRTQLPTAPVRRLILLAGRRAGKDRFLRQVHLADDGDVVFGQHVGERDAVSRDFGKNSDMVRTGLGFLHPET